MDCIRGGKKEKELGEGVISQHHHYHYQDSLCSSAYSISPFFPSNRKNFPLSLWYLVSKLRKCDFLGKIHVDARLPPHQCCTTVILFQKADEPMSTANLKHTPTSSCLPRPHPSLHLSSLSGASKHWSSTAITLVCLYRFSKSPTWHRTYIEQETEQMSTLRCQCQRPCQCVSVATQPRFGRCLLSKSTRMLYTVSEIQPIGCV